MGHRGAWTSSVPQLCPPVLLELCRKSSHQGENLQCLALGVRAEPQVGGLGSEHHPRPENNQPSPLQLVSRNISLLGYSNEWRQT